MIEPASKPHCPNLRVGISHRFVLASDAVITAHLVLRSTADSAEQKASNWPNLTLIAHRGASGKAPEHPRAYELACVS
jgi:glycerophosphoryl diester phosphodiesterase